MAKSKKLGSVESIDTRCFKATQDTFKTAIDNFQAERENIQTTTNNLLEVWQGEARNTFESKYDLFSDKMKDLQDVLTDFYNALLDAEMAYRETDEELGKEILDGMQEKTSSYNGNSK